MTEPLDTFECKIFAIIPHDATRSPANIADEGGMSQSPCWRGIQRMREVGIIRAEVALVDRSRAGLTAHLFARQTISIVALTDIKSTRAVPV